MLHRLKGHEGSVQALTVSSDSSLMVTVSNDGSGIVWNLANGAKLFVLGGGRIPVSSCAFLDERRVAIGSNQGSIAIWDALTGEQVHEVQAHRERVRTCVFDQGTQALISGGYDGRVVEWDSQTWVGREIGRHDRAIIGMCCASSDQGIVVGTVDGLVHMWNRRTQEAKQILGQHNDSVTGIAALHPNRCVSSGMDGQLLFWCMESHQLLGSHTIGVPIDSIAVSASYLVAGDRQGSLWVFERTAIP